MLRRFLRATKGSGVALRISAIYLHWNGSKTQCPWSRTTHRRVIHVRGKAIVTIGAGLECADENARLIHGDTRPDM